MDRLRPLDAGYKVVDANGQVLAYVYGLDDSRDARIAKALTRDEAAIVTPSPIKPSAIKSQPQCLFSMPLNTVDTDSTHDGIGCSWASASVSAPPAGPLAACRW